MGLKSRYFHIVDKRQSFDPNYISFAFPDYQYKIILFVSLLTLLSKQRIIVDFRNEGPLEDITSADVIIEKLTNVRFPNFTTGEHKFFRCSVIESAWTKDHLLPYDEYRMIAKNCVQTNPTMHL